MLRKLQALKEISLFYIPFIILLKFSKRKLPIKFNNGVRIVLDFKEFRYVVGVRQLGFDVLGEFKDGFLFDFYNFKL